MAEAADADLGRLFAFPALIPINEAELCRELIISSPFIICHNTARHSAAAIYKCVLADAAILSVKYDSV